MISLAIDASTYTGTVALVRDGVVIASGEARMRGRDVESLMPEVALTLAAAEVTTRELSRIICGAGPGSFTSLRIAASISKGLAVGVGCPLFAVSSLALLAAGDVEPVPGRYLGVLDALRGETYVAGYAFAADGDVTMISPERIVRQSDVDDLAASLDAAVVGPGQAIDRMPHARAVAAVESLISRTGAVDIASWEPGYGRKAEAQTRWEALHRQPLPSGGNTQ